MDKRIFELQAETLKALGHPVRLEIIDLLNKRELCFTEILEIVGGIKSTLSQHLSILVDKGILKCRKDSRCNYFSLSSAKITKLYDASKEVLRLKVSTQKKLLADIEL